MVRSTMAGLDTLLLVGVADRRVAMVGLGADFGIGGATEIGEGRAEMRTGRGPDRVTEEIEKD